ncbi:MAG: hypothetical protein AABW93_03675 [Nanoarchaeota archaeon]
MDRFNKQTKSPDGLQYYCKDCLRKVGRKWDSEHREYRNKTSREAKAREYKRDPEKFKERVRKYHALHPEVQREAGKRKRLRLRMGALEAYGMKCACCGESELKFLSIDHINGGGGKHRRKLKGHFYQWLKVNKYPVGFQTLCHNCNQAKGYYGQCPHKRKGGNSS